jgi:arylsulfatase A-like enzyme
MRKIELPARPVLICYVPGLDQRRLSPELTPNTCSIRETFLAVDLKTIPTTELVPTMITGVLPHQHQVWQVSLRPEYRTPSRLTLADHVPDLLTTTIQCARHLADRSYDLAALPYRRRRRFHLHRFKYTRREAEPECMQSFGGFQTVFGVLGDRSQYVFTKNFGDLNSLAQSLPASDHLLSLVEMYALDLLQHWHLDNPAVMADALRRTDEFIGRLIEGCDRTGKRLVLLVDHGQEPVTGTIPLIQSVNDAGISQGEFTFFVELASARFWFHTDRARDAILPRLKALADTTVLHYRDMHDIGVCFEDDSFGEFYAIADAGKIFFPHDFYQPIGNAILGATDRHQRQRFMNPVHRGNHGYLPHFPSERGWILTTDKELSASVPEGHIVDIAPTLLSLAGAQPPPHMSGRTLFHPASDPA